MQGLRRLGLVGFLSAATGSCDSGSPTAPELPEPPVPAPAVVTQQLFSGSLRIGTFRASTADAGIRCALNVLRDLAGQSFDFSLRLYEGGYVTWESGLFSSGQGNHNSETGAIVLTADTLILASMDHAELARCSDHYSVKVVIERIVFPAVGENG